MASHYISRQEIWNFFYNLFGGNEYAAAGACGNMQHESGLASDNAENSWNNKTEKTDEWLTDGINNGTITLSEFLKKAWYVNTWGFGYGLSQWTTSDRRTLLWNRTIARSINIDDIQAQLEYITWEFTEGKWAGLRNRMADPTACSSVRQATSMYCDEYEGGSWNTNRLKYANSFYDDFAGSISGYPIHITVEGNGYAWASYNELEIFSGEAGIRIELGAVPNDNDYFLLWTVDYPSSLTLELDATVADNYFTMPASKVDLTAHFTGTTPAPPPYPPEPPVPILNPIIRKGMPPWMYPVRRC